MCCTPRRFRLRGRSTGRMRARALKRWRLYPTVLACSRSWGAPHPLDRLFLHNCRAMYALAPRRCPHCVGVLAALQVGHADEFHVRGPVVVCARCDGVPGTDETLRVSEDWD